jgi:hypothetical protein
MVGTAHRAVRKNVRQVQQNPGGASYTSPQIIQKKWDSQSSPLRKWGSIHHRCEAQAARFNQETAFACNKSATEVG